MEIFSQQWDVNVSSRSFEVREASTEMMWLRKNRDRRRSAALERARLFFGGDRLSEGALRRRTTLYFRDDGDVIARQCVDEGRSRWSRGCGALDGAPICIAHRSDASSGLYHYTAKDPGGRSPLPRKDLRFGHCSAILLFGVHSGRFRANARERTDAHDGHGRFTFVHLRAWRSPSGNARSSTTSAATPKTTGTHPASRRSPGNSTITRSRRFTNISVISNARDTSSARTTRAERLRFFRRTCFRRLSSFRCSEPSPPVCQSRRSPRTKRCAFPTASSRAAATTTCSGFAETR